MTSFIDIDDVITTDGFRLNIALSGDMDCTPWDWDDSQGPVSEWTSRAKLPGEIILCQDRGSKRYYNFAEACRIARRDKWDAKPYNTGQESKRQQAAKAAMADYKRLRAYCEGHWQYVCIGVHASKRGTILGSAYLGGVESDAHDYIVQCANELTDKALSDAKAELRELAA